MMERGARCLDSAMDYSNKACFDNFSAGYGGNSYSGNIALSNTLSSHNNFINVSGHLISNLKKDKL
jgi:hypothetical protein